MRISQFKDFISGRLSSEQLRSLIAEEVRQYMRGLSERGRSAPIVLIDDTELTFTEEDVARLCSAFINNELTDYELAYLSDAILLSEQVTMSNPKLHNMLEEMTDPDVQGKFTKDRAIEMLGNLGARI